MWQEIQFFGQNVPIVGQHHFGWNLDSFINRIAIRIALLTHLSVNCEPGNITLAIQVLQLDIAPDKSFSRIVCPMPK